jgi:hypothetical protein
MTWLEFTFDPVRQALAFAQPIHFAQTSSATDKGYSGASPDCQRSAQRSSSISGIGNDRWLSRWDGSAGMATERLGDG